MCSHGATTPLNQNAVDSRRTFVKRLAAVGALGALAAKASTQASTSPAQDGTTRGQWVSLAKRVSLPVLEALARRSLRHSMPVEAIDPIDRARFTHLEALGRTLMGIAPWLEATGLAPEEEAARARVASLCREALDAGTDPKSPDYMNFTDGNQPLVDAAFLAQALLRAPRALWGGLDRRVQGNVLDALERTRALTPGLNNWLLFSSMVETALGAFGRSRNDARLFDGPTHFVAWYKGDGLYGDGPEFHADYYNAFVIQPMLLEVYDAIGSEGAPWKDQRPRVEARLRRYAALQERSIAPDGTYPVFGRSIAYRCGAFQGLALAALRGLLPDTVTPGQARRALSRVIRRTLEAPGTFDDAGWLRIGLAGHQPSIGEVYISTGSLYLCTAAFLPLGLSPTAPFWAQPEAPLTSEKAWTGVDIPADHALQENS